MGAPAGGGSVSFAEPPGESKLLELERTLAAKDAVMEPEVLATLRDYVKSGGKAEAAIELLSENYRGYAQMTGLVCKWLEITEPEGEKAAHRGRARARGVRRAQRGGIAPSRAGIRRGDTNLRPARGRHPGRRHTAGRGHHAAHGIRRVLLEQRRRTRGYPGGSDQG
jgi:hypothetical protein